MILLILVDVKNEKNENKFLKILINVSLVLMIINLFVVLMVKLIKINVYVNVMENVRNLEMVNVILFINVVIVWVF